MLLAGWARDLGGVRTSSLLPFLIGLWQWDFSQWVEGTRGILEIKAA